MRPLHGLILLLALVALLVGGLLWLGGSHSADGVGANTAQSPAPARVEAPETVLSAPEGDDFKAERSAEPGAVAKLEGTSGREASLAGLHGRVIGGDGKPVPGAKVYAAPGGGFNMLPLDAFDAKMLPFSKRGDTQTDADGRFQLDLSGQTQVRLAVRAGGFAPLDTEKTLARGEADLGDVQLEQGVVLEGRVIDQLGRPVADAQLFSRPRTAGFGMEMMTRGRAPLATTDEKGHFRIDMLAGGPWRMLVTTETHPDKSFDGETSPPGAVARSLEFALEEGAEIAGRVSGAAADLLPKLQVSAQARSENEDGGGGGVVFGAGGFSMPRTAKLAADGSFVLRGLKPNQNYRLDAQKADSGFFGFGMGSRAKGVSAKSGDRGIEVPYAPSSAILCEVVDATTGKPVTEMDVKAGSGFMLPLMEANGKARTTFPDGKVCFDRLPPDFGGQKGLKLRIDATGYKSFESSELTPLAGQDLDLGIVRLERAPVCRVQVLDASSGQPVAGAEVTLREAGAEQNGFGGALRIRRAGPGGGRTINDAGVSQGTTDSEGRVVLSSFPGKQATLKVKHSEHADWQSASLALAPSADHEETVKLFRGGDVLVTVVDAKGAPVAGVEIEHSVEGAEEGEPFMRRFSGEGDTRTDARGELLVAHLAPGAHRFRVADGNGPRAFFGGGGGFASTVLVNGGQGEEPKEPSWTSVDVLEGAQAAVKLVAPARANVVGRVREGGRPLAGASVQLEEKNDSQPGGFEMPFFGGGGGQRTNGNGEYKLENVKPGKYTIHVSHPSRAMTWDGELEVTEGDLRYDAELPVSIVEGRVLGPDGKGIAGARVSCERAKAKTEERQMVFSIAISGDNGDAMTFGGSGGGEAQRTDAEGNYTLRGVLTDTDIVVHATSKDFSPANSEKFRVVADQTLRGIDVHPKQGGILDVHVTRAGQPVRNALVNASHKDKDGNEDSQQTEMTGPGGIAHFAGLEPGDWEYSVDELTDVGDSPDSTPKQSKTVVVTAGQTNQVEHELH
ncbi:MAG: carboxypeptidase regulatory-like domain-containing protein [Planctomycetes bacterium]|nr:carboxypeptidase regulatory-like domain-containing protein [Planctomycetota bacterium]